MKHLPAAETVADMAEIVRSTSRLLPIGARTKPTLTCTDAPLLPLAKLRGITEHAVEDFTITALAGTSLREIDQALKETGQRLGFDAPFMSAGATLGGVVAAGLNGPGSYRNGGIRDSVIGVTFVDGRGEILTVGGRVAKNVAGFDLPKFFVGSLGRLGILTEITLKVLPRPTCSRTYLIEVRQDQELVDCIQKISMGSGDLEAIDAQPLERRILIRLSGSADTFRSRIPVEYSSRLIAAETESPTDSPWQHLTRDLPDKQDGALLKVPTNLRRVGDLIALARGQPDTQLYLTRAGDLAYLRTPSLMTGLRQKLTQAKFASMLICGNGPLLSGSRTLFPAEQRIVSTLDPFEKFPPMTFAS